MNALLEGIKELYFYFFSSEFFVSYLITVFALFILFWIVRCIRFVCMI